METGFNGLLEALTITKEISAVFPPLQAAVGGLLAALEKYKASIVGWAKGAMRAPSFASTDN